MTRIRDAGDDELLEVYRTMPTAHVKRAWNAFSLDIADRHAAGAELVTFAERRLAVIRQVLEERHEVLPGGGLFDV